MRKTLIALMFAAALPTVAMAAPAGGAGPDFDAPGMHMDRDHRGPGMHRGQGPLEKLDLTREQRQQIGKLMGEQMHERRDITQRYLAKLSAADQKAMKDEIAAKKAKTDSEIRGLLKPEQQKQFDDMKKKQEERRAEWAEFKVWKAEKDKKAQ
ncbi:LTXXQ domain-containing protein [Pseudomonas sp. R1-18]|uniref:LTXXQ domain-containing protein n=1 Tax=Pseudomonas sp. R1-18 TaxID=1632772 RepID=UPI003DA7D14C